MAEKSKKKLVSVIWFNDKKCLTLKLSLDFVKNTWKFWFDHDYNNVPLNNEIHTHFHFYLCIPVIIPPQKGKRMMNHPGCGREVL